LFKGASRNPMIPGTLSTSTMFTNSVIHDLDSAHWLMGQPIREVFVRGVRTRSTFSAETLDLLLTQLVLADGSLATIEASLAVEYGYEIFAEVVGERGVAEAMQPDQARVRLQQQAGVAVPQDWLARFQTAYVAEFQAWIDALHQGTLFPGASAWDGYVASLAAEACIESLRTGLPVAVPIPSMPELYQAGEIYDSCS
jgi:myo-inositol 2-dehydrogenase / D-chiro-inositol 1-dehydrogenase